MFQGRGFAPIGGEAEAANGKARGYERVLGWTGHHFGRSVSPYEALNHHKSLEVAA